MPIPIERLAWDQRAARVDQLAAIRRAYENDGSRLPAATERIRELRHELRHRKAVNVLLITALVFQAIGILALLWESWR